MAIETIDVVQTSLRKSTDATPALGSDSVILVERYAGESAQVALAAAVASGSTRRRWTKGQYNNLRLKASATPTPTPNPTPTVPAGQADANGWVNHDVVSTFRDGNLLWLQNSDGNGGIHWADLALLEASVRGGANWVLVIIPWYNTELRKTPGQYDFRVLLNVLGHAKRLGLNVWLRWSYNRETDVDDQYSSNDENFIPLNEVQRDDLGELGTAHRKHVASFDGVVSFQRIFRWVRAGMTAVQNSGFAGLIIGASPAPNSGEETEYPRGNGDGDVRRTFDYSEPARLKFIERAKDWYGGSLAVANNRWKTEFLSWDAVRLPIPQFDDNRIPNFNTRFLKDFYYHREQSLVETTNAFCAIIKGFSANLKTMAEPGNIVDNLCINRGTLTYAPLLNVDLLGNNNQRFFPYELSSALALRNRQGKGTKDEIEYHPDQSEQDRIDWFVASWKSGVRNFDRFAYHKGTFGDTSYEDTIAKGCARLEREMKACHAAIAGLTPPDITKWDREMVISGDALLDAVNYHNSGDFNRFYALSENGKYVVKLTITPLTRPS